MKNNKGITLISLVVTIIVLLILAGVTITMLAGDNSILKRSQTAAEESAMANTKELIVVGVNEALAEYNAKRYVDNDTTSDLLATLLNELVLNMTANDNKESAIEKANAIKGIEIAAKTGSAGTYEVKYNGVKKAEFSVSTTTGALTWTPTVAQS